MGSDVAKAVSARSDLAHADRVIVSIGMSGCVLIERDGPATLVYDPLHQDGDWEQEHPGTPVGLGTCVTAALVVQAVRSPQQPDWPQAARRGLTAARAVHDGRDVQSMTVPSFPIERIARLLANEQTTPSYEIVDIPDQDTWRIFTAVASDDHHSIAGRIVIEGVEDACRGLPIERFGAWSSIDRSEIESMRSVRTIIREYVMQLNRTRPLSLAVFGPPGSGKSFAIKQMARKWMGSEKVTILEINLSQLASPQELPLALQRVRDCAVEGALPLVFWDEFDTAIGGRELGWLAQFLGPMQDGAYADGGISRPIGPAIFIFAGGTHPTMASFKARAVDLPAAKATDFLSRLRGYVDILGPNPQSEQDETFPLRRALLLRAILFGKAPAIIHHGRVDIDPGVLRAFLNVTTYVHGARSMEAIVDMSTLAGKLRFERSALPPAHQLSLHVDAREFFDLVQMQLPR
jgi:hypothetical protein